MRRVLIPLLLIAAVAGGATAFLLRKPGGEVVELPKPLDIWFTCDTSGRIEPCGCFTGQYGGLTRVSSVLRDAPAHALKLEIGNALAGLEDYQVLQFGKLLAAEAAIGYQAVNLGAREASLPAETLRTLVAESPLPLVSANVLDADTGEPIAAPFHLAMAGGLRVGLLGVVAPDTVKPDPSVRIGDMLEALRRFVPAAREKCDLLVCMAFASETQMEEIARAFYEIPLILGGDVRQPSQALGRVNQSYLLATTNQARALGAFHAEWDPVRRTLVEAKGTVSLMHDSIPQDPAIAAFSAAYRKEIREIPLNIDRDSDAANRVPGVDPTASFVGSESCAGCHPTTFATWRKSGHAHAFDSLVRKESDADPSCIACHVIGFGEPGGYRRDMKADRLVDVGCESCHGPGGEHVKARSAATLTGDEILQKMRPVGPGQCVQCHHGEFSRPFHYEEFWPLIQHGKESPPGS